MGSDSEKKRKRKKKDDKERHKHKKSKHKHKKKHKKEKRKSSSSSSSDSDDGWVERPVKTFPEPKSEQPLERDDWMSMKTIATFSKEKDKKDDDKKMYVEQYDPRKSSRELNPYWKDGDGTGLPSFKKPREDDYYTQDTKIYNSTKQEGWKKAKATSSRAGDNLEVDIVSKTTSKNDDIEPCILSNDDLNKLSARVMKAELMGDL